MTIISKEVNSFNNNPYEAFLDIRGLYVELMAGSKGVYEDTGDEYIIQESALDNLNFLGKIVFGLLITICYAFIQSIVLLFTTGSLIIVALFSMLLFPFVIFFMLCTKDKYTIREYLNVYPNILISVWEGQ